MKGLFFVLISIFVLCSNNSPTSVQEAQGNNIEVYVRFFDNDKKLSAACIYQNNVVIKVLARASSETMVFDTIICKDNAMLRAEYSTTNMVIKKDTMPRNKMNWYINN